MPKRPHNLPEERPQRAQVAVLLQQQLQEDDGQAVRRLLPVGGEDHVEGGHVARVPGVGELVEDDLGGNSEEKIFLKIFLSSRTFSRTFSRKFFGNHFVLLNWELNFVTGKVPFSQ